MVNETDPKGDQRTGTTVSAGAWTMVERVLSQASQLIIFVAAARLLSPAEFGSFALVSACAILLMRFAEAGWSQYIMSWRGDDTVPRQVLFFAMTSGVCVAILGWLAGLSLPLFGTSAEISQLVMLFSLWVVLATTSSAQKGMMIRHDKLRSSAAAEITGEIVGMSVALYALFSGYGVLSLAMGRLAFQVVHLLVSFSITRKAPLTGMTSTDRKKLLEFSGQVLSSRMIYNVRLYLATFIIGGFLGPAAVGYYRAAERLVGAMFEIIGVPGEVLAWSLFRKTRDAQPKDSPPTTGFQERANSYFFFLLAASLPLFVWMTLLGEDLISGVLGAEWLPALPVVAILALARATMVPGVATEALLSMSGEIRRLPRYTVILFAVSALVTTVFAQFGLHAIAWAQVITGVITIAVMLRPLRRFAGVDLLVAARSALTILPPLALGAGVLYILRDISVLDAWNPVVRAVAVSVPAVAIYAATLAVLDTRFRQIIDRRAYPQQNPHGD